MTDKVYVTDVRSYNQYAEERYSKAVDAWNKDEGFPYYGMYVFEKNYGYVRYRVNEDGAILSARWARTKKELLKDTRLY